MASRATRFVRQHAPWVVALFLLLGTGSYAVASGKTSSNASDKRFYACVTQAYGTLNLTTAKATCPRGQRKISWDANGKRGPAGPTGAQGDAGAQGATGVKGESGATGANGAKGEAGANGATGAKGETGATGTNGDSGPAGVPGPQGPQGPQGPVGPAGQSASFEYGRVYNVGAEVVAVEADIVFDRTGLRTSGIQHTPGTSHVTVTTAGEYLVRFSVSSVEPNQFALFINGALSPGSIFGSGAGTQQNVGETIVILSAGDVLTLRNHSSASAVTLQTLTGGTQTNTNASLFIQQLGEPQPR